MRTLLASAAIASTLATPVAIAPAVHAEDHRPCVSKAEFHQLDPSLIIDARGDVPASPSRQQLEREWDVRGIGHVSREDSTKVGIMWIYPACGFSYNDGQVWVIVDRRDLKVAGAYRYVYFDAVHHGRP